MPPALGSPAPSRILPGRAYLAAAFFVATLPALAADPNPVGEPSIPAIRTSSLLPDAPLTVPSFAGIVAFPVADTPKDVELPDAPNASEDTISSSVLSNPPHGATLIGLVRPENLNFAPSGASPSSARGLLLVSPAGQPITSRERDVACQSGALKGKSCRYSWGPILWEMFEATAIENVGNITLDTETRHDVLTRPYWSTYIKCVHQYRYRQWSDDTPFIVHNIGHPMQGAAVYSIVAQNDPHTRGLPIANNGNYWRGKLKAMAIVTLYEIQWKIGPASEAAIGNSGLNTYFTPSVHGRSTNETGFQDFVITPVYGLGWNMAEDLADRYIMPRVWRHTHNKWALTAYSVLTPCKALANVLRYKPFYYRDFDLPPVGSAAVRH